MGNEGTTMRAWRLHRYGQPTEVLQLEDVPIPEPGPGEVVVKAAGIPLNLNDLERITGGNMMARPEFPYSPGMEIMGTVHTCGAGAEHLAGRRVAGLTRQAHGGYAEYVICPASSLFDLPESIPLPDAAALFMPFHLAWLGLVDRAGLTAGESVLIHAAAGGSGSAAIQIAKVRGARVFATAGSEEKLALCRSLGADVTIDYNEADFADVVLAETGGAGVDVVFDNVGEAVLEKSMKATAYNGRYVSMGFASNKVVADEPFYVPRRLMMGNFKFCGVMMSYAPPPMVGMIKGAMGWNVIPNSIGETIQREIVGLVEAGKVRAVIGKQIGFEDLPQAIEDMAARGTTGRVVAVV